MTILRLATHCCTAYKQVSNNIMNRHSATTEASSASLVSSANNLIQVDPTFFEVCQFEHALKKVYSVHGEKIDDRLIPSLHLLTQRNKQKKKNITALTQKACENEKNRIVTKEMECSILLPLHTNNNKKFSSIPSYFQEQIYQASLHKRHRYLSGNCSSKNLLLSGLSVFSSKLSKSDTLVDLEAQMKHSKPPDFFQLDDKLIEDILGDEKVFETSSTAVLALSAHFSTATLPQNATLRNLNVLDDQAVIDDYLDMLEEWEKWHGKFLAV